MIRIKGVSRTKKVLQHPRSWKGVGLFSGLRTKANVCAPGWSLGTLLLAKYAQVALVSTVLFGRDRTIQAYFLKTHTQKVSSITSPAITVFLLWIFSSISFKTVRFGILCVMVLICSAYYATIKMELIYKNGCP